MRLKISLLSQNERAINDALKPYQSFDTTRCASCGREDQVEIFQT